jgi:hypothetical protein
MNDPGLARQAAPSIRPSLLFACVALAALAVMVPALSGPFLFDDVPLIAGNHYVQHFEYWTRWFTGQLWDSNFDPAIERQSRGFWRPLVLLSYAVDWQAGGGSPLAFHVTNQLVHALNACLVLCVLMGWLRNNLAAVAGALVFAVHPAQTEPVAWIAGRTDSLCALGLLIATLGLRRFIQRGAVGLPWLALGLGVALLSKEMAVVFPVLALIERWSAQRPALDLPTCVRLTRQCAPFVALSLIYALAHRFLVETQVYNAPPSVLARVGLVLEAYGRYTALVLWPDDLSLGRAGLELVAGVPRPDPVWAAFGLLTCLGCLALSFTSRRHLPALSLGLLGYLALLLPVSSAKWLGYDVLVSPRFLYLPLLGVSLALGAVVSQLAQLPRPSTKAERLAPVLALLGCVALASLSARSFARSGDYASEDDFWRVEITQNPDYAPAQQYFITRELRQGRPRAALHLAHGWFQRLSANRSYEPKKAQLIVNSLGAIMALTPDLDLETLAQVQEFATALSHSRPASLALPKLGLGLAVGEDRGLLANLANNQRPLKLIAAEAAARRGDDAQATALVEQALAGCESCWTILINAGLVLARSGQLDAADALAARAERVAPPGKVGGLRALVNDARALAPLASKPGLGQVRYYAALGAYGRAYTAAQPALAAPPRDPQALERLAQLAYLAGDEATSQELLSRLGDAASAEATLAQFAEVARWKEKPLPAGLWSPHLTRVEQQ